MNFTICRYIGMVWWLSKVIWWLRVGIILVNLHLYNVCCTSNNSELTNLKAAILLISFIKSTLSSACDIVFLLGKRRYNIKLWKTFTDCFNCLPVAAIVDEKIFCCHGGLSPDLQSMEQIRRIMRPTDVPDQGLLCDLLWSDPDKVTGFLT